METMHEAYLSLGSNLRDREANLRGALAELNASPHCEVVKVSSAYETSPVGFATPNRFLNCCVQLNTSYAPPELLSFCQRIEEKLGRPGEVTRVEYEDRVIDIDLILFGLERLHTSTITIPHPGITRRLFVLVPLAEMAPGILIENRSVEVWIEEVRRAHPEQQVEKLFSLDDALS